LAHIVLSVLVGALLWSLASHTLPWAAAPTALRWAPEVPGVLRAALAVLGAGCLASTLLDVAALITQTPPPPVHVAIRLRAPLAEIWRITQDHRLHPAWDHRFTEITMLSAPIMTGTCMRYDKRIAGMVVRGFGRYKLHRPMQQSTFEFWSDDRRSPIRRGVGLWRYITAADGSVEFRTSYTYDVRWGLAGRVLDRVILRRWFQRETERSFARLGRDFFPEGAGQGPVVAGRRGRKPEALAA
ncbi:MAG: SRPBCC family protein, partial [Kofleriaceae bacterium]